MERKLAEWFVSNDTGASSKAVALYLASGVTDGCVPHDSADFGRCYRLLAHMGWQDRISEMASATGHWSVLVEIWPQLTAAYEADDHSEVYRLLKSIEADGYERDGYTVVRRPDGGISFASKNGAFTMSARAGDAA